MKKLMKASQTTVNLGKIIMIIMVLSLGTVALLWNPVKESLKKEETVYCHFETNFTQKDFPRFECRNMKIVSKDMYLINLSQFQKLNETKVICSKNYETLPDCSGSNYYISMFKLDMLCSNCSVDGYTCSEVYIDYYTNNSLNIMQYEEAFFQEKLNSKEALQIEFNNCTGESYGK